MRAIVEGTIFSSCERKTSKAGKEYAGATIKTGFGQEWQFQITHALRSRVTMRYGGSMDLSGYDLDNVADCGEICYSAKRALWACSLNRSRTRAWSDRGSTA